MQIFFVCVGKDEGSCVEKYPKQVRMVNTIVLTKKIDKSG